VPRARPDPGKPAGSDTGFPTGSQHPGSAAIKWAGCHTRRRLEDAVRGRRQGTELRPPRERRRDGQGSNPDCATASQRSRRTATSPIRKGTQGVWPCPNGEASGARTDRSRTDRRPREPCRRPQPNAGRPRWSGPGPDGSRRRPRPAPGMRSPARTREGERPRPRVERPSRFILPLTACPSVLHLGGPPPLPGTHRYQRGGLPSAPSPQARRCRLRLSPPARRRTKAPPTDRRGHEAMAAGAESGGGGRGRARSGWRGGVARARGFTAGLSRGVDLLGYAGGGSGSVAAVENARGCLVTASGFDCGPQACASKDFSTAFFCFRSAFPPR
jgi:hypothetical protein